MVVGCALGPDGLLRDHLYHMRMSCDGRTTATHGRQTCKNEGVDEDRSFDFAVFDRKGWTFEARKTTIPTS
jgi:hypothetical protein